VDTFDACLQALDEREAEVRAWVIVDRETAVMCARRLDEEIALGQGIRPLHGVVLGVKDIIDVAGIPTSAGVRNLDPRPAALDARIVAKLRAAGAVILGKTVSTAHAWIDPPATANPWDTTRTPGGSSSGSAAALAASMCLAALGSQTGGSITRPAAFCGVCGLKPTYGALESAGVLPLAPSLDHPGLMAATVSGLARLWPAVSASDPIAEQNEAPHLVRARGFLDDRAEPQALEAVDKFLDQMAAAGSSIATHLGGLDYEEILRRHRLIMAAEAAAVHEHRYREHPEDYPERISALIEEGRAIPKSAYQQALDQLRDARAAAHRMLDAGDVMVCPAALGEPPDRQSTGDPAFNSPWSYLGLPTVCMPVALSEAGLPLGVQLVGRPRAEPALLAAAAWCERALRGTQGL
jgi:aspartyl-tRNA(Asn)/glutamyl-tRNA(Gln) amidotransferase subunit A